MGSPSEMEANAPSSHTKATFSGATAFIGVLALIVTIISVAVPHWGSYGPNGFSYQAQGKLYVQNNKHIHEQRPLCVH